MTTSPPPETPPAAGSDEVRDPRSKRIEVVIAALLGVVAVLTAFATYKAVLEDGDTLANFNEGIALNVQAAERDTAGLQEYSTDQATYLEWIKSEQEGDTETSAYLRETLFSEELEEGVKWVEEGPKDAISPFQEASPYGRPEFDEAEKLRKQTSAKFAEAKVHDEDGDKYVLATVVLSIALFLLGIAGVNRQYRVQLGLTVLGAIVSVIGLVQILSVGV